jgi:hypothetical protein
MYLAHEHWRATQPRHNICLYHACERERGHQLKARSMYIDNVKFPYHQTWYLNDSGISKVLATFCFVGFVQEVNHTCPSMQRALLFHQTFLQSVHRPEPILAPSSPIIRYTLWRRASLLKESLLGLLQNLDLIFLRQVRPKLPVWVGHGRTTP